MQALSVATRPQRRQTALFVVSYHWHNLKVKRPHHRNMARRLVASPACWPFSCLFISWLARLEPGGRMFKICSEHNRRYLMTTLMPKPEIPFWEQALSTFLCAFRRCCIVTDTTPWSLGSNLFLFCCSCDVPPERKDNASLHCAFTSRVQDKNE